jgi:hypothetical protein
MVTRNDMYSAGNKHFSLPFLERVPELVPGRIRLKFLKPFFFLDHFYLLLFREERVFGFLRRIGFFSIKPKTQPSKPNDTF